MSIAGYVNPFLGDASVTPERVDQGKDFALTPGEAIKAIGDAVIKGIIPDWSEGQPLLYYQLTSGPDAGKYVYVAEQINPAVSAGQRVSAGQTIATYASSGTGIETGWATATGQTLAMATTGYHEGEATPAGKSFASFLEGVDKTSKSGPSELIPGEYSVPVLGGVLKKAGELGEGIGGSASSALEAIPKKVVEFGIESVKPIALRVFLYAVLLLGGLALAGYGLAAMLKPAPSTGKAARRAGELAGAAA